MDIHTLIVMCENWGIFSFYLKTTKKLILKVRKVVSDSRQSIKVVQPSENNYPMPQQTRCLSTFVK